MANSILLAEQIKHMQDEMIAQALTYGFCATLIKPREMYVEPVFHWYVGHDPYNSADNVAFMDRVAARQ